MGTVHLVAHQRKVALIGARDGRAKIAGRLAIEIHLVVVGLLEELKGDVVALDHSGQVRLQPVEDESCFIIAARCLLLLKTKTEALLRSDVIIRTVRVRTEVATKTSTSVKAPIARTFRFEEQTKGLINIRRPGLERGGSVKQLNCNYHILVSADESQLTFPVKYKGLES